MSFSVRPFISSVIVVFPDFRFSRVMLVTFLRVHSEAFAWLGYAPRNVVQVLDAKGCHCSVCLRWGDRLGGIDVQPLAPAVRVGPFKFFVHPL